MADEKAHPTMADLVAALEQAVARLGAGDLRADALELTTAQARDLYERLLVLRHKARERAATKAPPLVPSEQALRLDTRPLTDTRQTSLIDAIAETEKRGKGGKKVSATVATKRERAPLADLNQGIALSQKFWFINELFSGDRAAYDAAIAKLNALPDLEQAKTLARDEIFARAKRPPAEDVRATLLDLIERRYR
jgi:hypothetical protein